MPQLSTLPEPLANWDYAPGEWARFVQKEKKRFWNEGVLITIGILIFGTILLRILRHAPLWAGLLVSFGIAIAYAFVRYLVRFHILSVLKRNKVIIYRHAALLNGEWLAWSGNARKLEGISILEKSDPKILEITYSWNTRSGPAFDEIRIPIPKGKLGEAVRLMDMIGQQA